MLNVLSAAQTLVLINSGPREDEYPVYPEKEGEWDRPINPYAPG
jgi:hypothetical protein